MGLQYKFFSIPIPNGDEAEQELNAFLQTVRLAQVQREIVNAGGGHYWAVAVEYLQGGSAGGGGTAGRFEPGKRKVDYKETLSPENFAVFAKLREWRKAAAAREAVQLYTVFMNEQLAAMVERRVTTKKALMEIEGVGEGRVSKYGDEVLAILQAEFAGENHEAGGEPVLAHS